MISRHVIRPAFPLVSSLSLYAVLLLFLNACGGGQVVTGDHRFVTVNAAGDILLARDVEKIEKKHTPGYMFRHVASKLADADISIINLETSVSKRGTPKPGKPRSITLRADPSMLAGLKDSGVDVVSLSNNHATDYGADALKDTIAHTSSLGIGSFGAGMNEDEARKPYFIERKGQQIAFIGYAEPVWNMYRAGKKSPGVSLLITDEIVRDIRNLRKGNPGLLIIPVLHWCDEFSHYPADRYVKIAHALIDAGADGIIGHHTHVLDGVEIYKGKPVFYSLGNFIFDFKEPDTRKSVMVKLVFDRREFVRAELFPVMIDPQECFPYFTDEREGEEIIGDIRMYSKMFSTEIRWKSGKGIIENVR